MSSIILSVAIPPGSQGTQICVQAPDGNQVLVLVPTNVPNGGTITVEYQPQAPQPQSPQAQPYHVAPEAPPPQQPTLQHLPSSHMQRVVPGTAVDTTGDGVGDSLAVDVTGDGMTDMVVPPRQHGGVHQGPSFHHVDTTQDGLVDSVAIDTTGDGRVDVIVPHSSFRGRTASPPGPAPGTAVDTTGDGLADSVAVDTTGDGRTNAVVPHRGAPTAHQQRQLNRMQLSAPDLHQQQTQYRDQAMWMPDQRFMPHIYEQTELERNAHLPKELMAKYDELGEFPTRPTATHSLLAQCAARSSPSGTTASPAPTVPSRRTSGGSSRTSTRSSPRSPPTTGTRTWRRTLPLLPLLLQRLLRSTTAPRSVYYATTTTTTPN